MNLPRDSVFGDYRILQPLGGSTPTGRGKVYQARHEFLGRLVALKFYDRSGSMVERLGREGRHLSRLHAHPHGGAVVQVYGQGVHQGSHYLALEWMDGGNAYEWAMAARASLTHPWVAATRIAADACYGLIAAHDSFVLHLDLKPHNILLSVTGQAKLSDFDAAVAVGPDRRCDTPPPGTVGYAAPEQATYADVRSDVYALGASYFHLLTGRRMPAPAHDPRAFAPDVPEACVRVVRTATAPAPADRYQTADDFWRALRAVLVELQDDTTARYLAWVRECNRTLRLPVLNRVVELDRVYTPLLVDTTTDQERQLTLELQAGRGGSVAGQVAAVPLTLTLEVRERPRGERTKLLHEVFRLSPVLVVLGEPGGGKTTVARWLARQAAACCEEGRPLAVRRWQLDPDADPTSTDEVAFGERSWVPVLVRAYDFADHLRRRRAGRQPVGHLIDYLGWPSPDAPDAGPTGPDGTPIRPEHLNALLRRAVADQRALVILDGLDEVPDVDERLAVRDAVQLFIRDHVHPGGNHLVVTSRPTGYHQAYLQGPLVGQVTVERMQPAAVRHFVRVWLGECGGPPEQTDALLAQLASAARPELAAISGNPLLCGVLAAVFHRHGGQLPGTKVQLFHLAVEEFLRVWEARTPPAARPFSRHQLRRYLERVAFVYHTDCPNGMMTGDNLRQLLVRLACDDRGLAGTLDTPPDVNDGVDALMGVLGEATGLLVPKSVNVYGFIHRLFQEYLAARHLASGATLEAVFEQLQTRLDSAEWHEPLLMAFGVVGMDHPHLLTPLAERVISEDTAVADLLPRGALKLVAALPDLPAPRPPALPMLLLQRLLFAYAGTQQPSHPLARLGELIERAVKGDDAHGRSLWHLEREATERAILSALDDPDAAPVAATLVRRVGWFTPDVGAALLAARRWDQAEWDWPVHAALREMATCPPPPLRPYPPTEFQQWEKLRQQHAAAGRAADNEQRPELVPQFRAELTRLTDDLAAHERQHAAVLQSHRERVAAHEQAMRQYEEVTQHQSRVFLPTADLPFRAAVEADPAVRGRVASHPDWFRLVVAVYGGLGDFRTPDRKREYYQYSNYLQLHDTVRRQFLPWLTEHWGADDPVYRIAVHLDTALSVWKATWERPPQFNPRFVVSDSPLTDLLLGGLRAGHPPDELVPQLAARVDDGTPDEQADAALALLVLWQVTPKLLAALRLPHVQRRLERAELALRDPVLRATGQIVPALAALRRERRTDTPEGWEAIADAALAVTVPGNPLAVSVLDLCGGDGDTAWALAEQCTSRFLGVVPDDAVYEAAVWLDTATQLKVSPAAFCRAIARAPLARHRQASVRIHSWPVEQLPPRRIDPDDLPEFVLTALENIPGELSMTRGWALADVCRPLAARNPQLLPELLAVIARDTGERSDREYALRPLAPDLVGHPDLAAEARRRADALTDPYHRARARVRLVPLFPNDALALRAAVLADARRVADPFRRAEVFERLLRVTEPGEAGGAWRWRAGGPRDRGGLLAEARRAVRAIRDPDDRARGLARLSAHHPPRWRERLLGQAVRTVMRLPHGYPRSHAIRLLHPQLFAHPKVLERLYRFIRAMPSDPIQAAADDAILVPLVAALPLVRAVDRRASVGWSVLAVAAAIRDVCPQQRFFNQAVLWANLRNPDLPDVAATLAHLGRVEGLTLHRVAAEVLDAATPTELARWEPLVPMLQSPDPEAVPVIASWLTRPPGPLRRAAALLLAESQGLSADLLPGVFELLRSADDLTRTRAAHVVHHPTGAPPEPTRRLSVLSRQVVEAIARERLDTRASEPDVSNRLAWHFQDVLCDDPAAVAGWVNAVRSDPVRAEVAAYCLAHTEAVTPAVWAVLRDALAVGPVGVRGCVLRSLMALVSKQRVTADQWAEVAAVLDRLGPEDLPDLPVMTGGADGIVWAAAEAAGADDRSLAAARRRHADRHQHRLNALLVARPPVPSGGVGHALPKWATPDTPAVDLLHWFCHLAANHLYWSIEPDKYLAPTADTARWVRDRPDVVRLLGEWLFVELAAPTPLSPFHHLVVELLLATARVSAIEQRAFAQLPNREALRRQLLTVPRRHPSRVGRSAAVMLLGRLGRFDRETAGVFAEAVTGVDDVRQAAMTAAGLFGTDDPELVTLLAGDPQQGTGLYHPSGLAAYQTGLVLEAFGRWAAGRLRGRVMVALAEAVRHGSSGRAVHFGHTHTRLPDTPRLDQLLHRVLLRVGNVGS